MCRTDFGGLFPESCAYPDTFLPGIELDFSELKLQLEFKRKNVVLSGYEINKSKQCWSSYLTEIRKEKRKPYSFWERGGQRKSLKDHEWICLFSENIRLQNLFLLWPECSLLASCPVSIYHWQFTITQHRVVAAAAVPLFSSNGEGRYALFILMLQMSPWGINRNSPDGTWRGDCFQSGKNEKKKLHRKL